MPYVSFKTTKVLTLQQELDLKTMTGKLISLLPNKTEDYLMIHIEDNQLMYFRGKEEDCMMISCKVYGHPALADQKVFVKELMKETEKITKIPVNNQYLTFSEEDHWGMNGEFI